MSSPTGKHAYVYVAGPYTGGDTVLNVREAVRIADVLTALGYTPFVPHLYHLWHAMFPADYERWMDLCLAWVERCDVLLRIPGESPGADREVEYAKKHGIPVFTESRHFHMQLQLSEWAQGRPIPSSDEYPPENSTWRHKKRGTTYLVKGLCFLQCEGALDETLCVIYRGDGRTWVRPVYEFLDGRFERTDDAEEVDERHPCCGCICGRCRDGHDAGPPHTDACVADAGRRSEALEAP